MMADHECVFGHLNSFVTRNKEPVLDPHKEFVSHNTGFKKVKVMSSTYRGVNRRQLGKITFVARSKQVCIEWMEATVSFPIVSMDNE
jgi:hypothetical protein